MQKDDRQLILFALAVCVTCSVLLSGVAAGLRDRQQREIELDRRINVLKAFGVETRDDAGSRISAADVDDIFADHIGEMALHAETGEEIDPEELDPRKVRTKEQLPLYYWHEDGERQRYAFPVSGAGLWSTIYGFLALDEDLATISGVTFYDHGETPGLGGEIERPWFQEQFQGKKLLKDGDPVEMQTVKGGVESRYPEGNPHAIDGISGATITGKGVTRFISEDFRRYNRFFGKIRDS